MNQFYEQGHRHTFQQFIEDIPSIHDHFWVIDHEYRLVEASTSWLKQLETALGTSINIGTNLLDLAEDLPNQLAAKWKNLYDRALAGEMVTVEMQFQLISNRWARLHLFPCKTLEGIKGVKSYARDIHEQKLAEISLKQANQRFELAAKGADGIWDWDVPNDLCYFSPRFRELMGYPSEEYIGGMDALAAVVHPDDKTSTQEALEQHLTNGLPFQHKYRLKTVMGEYRWFMVRGQAVWDENGVPLRMAGTLTDIHEWQRTERLMREMSEVGDIGGWSVNLLTDEHTWTDITRDIFDAPAGWQVNSMPDAFELYQAGDSRDRIRRDVQKAIEHCEPFDGEYEIISLQGKHKWVRAVGQVEQHDGRATRMYGMIQDVSERRLFINTLFRKSSLLEALVQVGQILMDGEDHYNSFYEAFQIVGKALEVDRVYYFEMEESPEDPIGLASQKIEWAKNGVEPMLNNPDLQNIPISQLTDFAEPLVRKQVFKAVTRELPDGETKQILEPQGILSLLVLPIFIHGKFKGFVGFDDCTRERRWSPDELSLLRTLAAKMGISIKKDIAQKALLESYERFEYATTATSDVVWELDLDKEQLFWAKGYEFVFGYEEGYFPFSDVFSQRIHPEDQERVRAGLDRAIHGIGQFWKDEYRYQKANGHYEYVSDSAIIIRNSWGKAIKLIGAMKNITREKMHIQAIEEQNRKLSEIAWIQSHVVRAPVARLMGLVSYMFYLNDTSPLGEEQKNLLDLINRSAEELDQIIYEIVERTSNVHAE